MVKNDISLRRDSDNLQYGKLRSYRGSRLVKFFLCIFINFKDTYETGSPTVSEIQIREREDAIVNETSPVPVSILVDDGSGQPD